MTASAGNNCFIIPKLYFKSDVFTKLVPQGNITVVHRSTNIMLHVSPEMRPFLHSGITILTGSIGDAGLGLKIKQGYTGQDMQPALQRFHCPEPRIKEGLAIRSRV
jgi:hypothetical protein